MLRRLRARCMATMCKCCHKKSIACIGYWKEIYRILERGPWLLHRPDSIIQKIPLAGRSLYLVRDDLIHPVYGGNKARKLDGILPRIVLDKATDIVSEVRIRSIDIMNCAHNNTNAAHTARIHIDQAMPAALIHVGSSRSPAVGFSRRIHRPCLQ